MFILKHFVWMYVLFMKCFYRVVKDIELKTHEPIIHEDDPLECLEEEQPVCKILHLKNGVKKMSKI
jgi:hypothetical protein